MQYIFLILIIFNFNFNLEENCNLDDLTNSHLIMNSLIINYPVYEIQNLLSNTTQTQLNSYNIEDTQIAIIAEKENGDYVYINLFWFNDDFVYYYIDTNASNFYREVLPQPNCGFYLGNFEDFANSIRNLQNADF